MLIIYAMVYTLDKHIKYIKEFMSDFDDLKKKAGQIMNSVMDSSKTDGVKPVESSIFSKTVHDLEQGSSTLEFIRKENMLNEGASFVKNLSELAVALRTGNYLQAIMEATEIAGDVEKLYQDGSGLKNAVEKDYDKIKNIYSDLSEKAGEIENKIIKDTKDVKENVTDGLGSLMCAAQDVWGATKTMITDVGKGIQDGSISEIANGFQKFSQTIQSGEIQKDIQQAIGDAKNVQEIVSKDVKSAQEIYAKAANIIGEVKSDIEPSSKGPDSPQTPEEIGAQLKKSGISGGQEVKSGQVSGEVMGGSSVKSSEGHSK